MPGTVFERAILQNDINALLVLNIEKLSRCINDLLWRQALEHGLSPLQIRLLLLIRHKADIQSAGGLAVALNISKATVSVALKPLIEKNLLSRRTSAHDARLSELRLTERGAQIAHIAGFYLEPVYQMMIPVERTEKEIMLKNLSGILGKLNELNM